MVSYAGRGPLPTFLIIGAQKSATRWLRTVLGEHPDVYTAPTEIMYFSRPRRVANQGPEWYRDQFHGWAGEPIVGEASTSYMASRRHPGRVAARIDELLPDAKLIALLRNPVDRAFSAFNHHIRAGRLPADADLMEHVRTVPTARDRLVIVSGGLYGRHLTPYFETFGDRLLLLIHEDIHDDAAGVYRRAVAHIGGDPTFLPPSLTRRVGSAPKRSGARGQRLTQAERAELFEHFRDDVAALEAVTGLDLSRWDPAPSDSRAGARRRRPFGRPRSSD
jgi:hypothetical protein